MLIPMTPQQATAFEFAKRIYTPENKEASFSYRVHFTDAQPLEFTETISLGIDAAVSSLPEVFLVRMLEDLHLVLGVSYYKLFCPPQLRGYPPLTEKQAAFWNALYRNGLGEFLYRNDLSPSIIAAFKGEKEEGILPAQLAVTEDAVLIGIGGGKDSIVSLELLKDHERTGFVVETGRGHGITDEVAQIAGVPLHKIRRRLDPQLLSGVPGSYNGHVPVSAIYAFLGVLEAALTESAYFVVSNEHSSNFGNVLHEGLEVNHKWSGSATFEAMMQEYVRENLTTSIRYFSLTRPFYELRVMKLFTALGEKYFSAFSSCNRNFTHHHDGAAKWCGECPKCAFTFLMLAAFLKKDAVVGIFKKDLFEDAALLSLYRDLLGLGTMKPFDCVGTFEESRAALLLAQENGWSGSAAVRELAPLLAETEPSPEVFLVQKAETVPSRFRLLGMESGLILGYGREGHASERFLAARYPHLRLGIADQQDDEEYLEKQHEFDIVVRTPVIPKEKVLRQSVTATQLFFASVPRKNIIGITGSKGKSTTSMLTYLLLRKAGMNVHLVGNIGVPALQYLLETPYEAEDLFVYELSSYQLEDLDVSPHIAVVTSLFPEHIDHHGSLEAYYEAKRSIVRFQEPDDLYLHAPLFPLLTKWEESTPAQDVIEMPVPFAITAKPLRGAHMHSNVALAYTIASLFGATGEEAENVINAFEGLPHRLQLIGTFKGIEFYDDSISTTPESAIAGIRALENVDTIILGGVDRGYRFEELEKEIRERGIRNVVLFPESGEHMLTSEEGLVVLHTSDMDEAVRFAFERTAAGKSCLLSPAAPSYNLFTNFEERGMRFAEKVTQYGTA
jgi:UDP-N-acetylmuramoylalanine--D-glutamate ligase